MEASVSIEDKLLTWLETQGYPLEMRVANELQKLGARVVQSEYFADPITGESREVDVVASWQNQFDDLIARFSLVIECKLSRDKPWILFTSEEARISKVASVSQRAASQLGDIATDLFAVDPLIQEFPIFQLPRAPGYGIKQAFNEKVDVCYSAITSVAAAVAAQAKVPDFQDGLTGGLYFCEFYFPVVVTDARLFTAKLNAHGVVELKEEAMGVLVWRNPVVDLPHTLIHIVTSAGLKSFVQQAYESAQGLLEGRSEAYALALAMRKKELASGRSFWEDTA